MWRAAKASGEGGTVLIDPSHPNFAEGTYYIAVLAYKVPSSFQIAVSEGLLFALRDALPCPRMCKRPHLTLILLDTFGVFSVTIGGKGEYGPWQRTRARNRNQGWGRQKMR